MGYVDELPVGLSIFGRQWSEGELIDIAYLYEQATKHRRAPKYIEKYNQYIIYYKTKMDT